MAFNKNRFGFDGHVVLFVHNLLYVFITVMYDDDDTKSKDKKKSSKKT